MKKTTAAIAFVIGLSGIVTGCTVEERPLSPEVMQKAIEDREAEQREKGYTSDDWVQIGEDLWEQEITRVDGTKWRCIAFKQGYAGGLDGCQIVDADPETR